MRQAICEKLRNLGLGGLAGVPRKADGMYNLLDFVPRHKRAGQLCCEQVRTAITSAQV